MKTNLASAICFVAWIASGLMATFGQRLLPGLDRRRLVTTFLWVSLFVSSVAGFSQHDMWPFSSWKMMTGLTPPATLTLPTLSILGIDSSGNEHEIDFRAWTPLSPEELNSWLRHNFFELDSEARDRAGNYLLARSNYARERALSSRGLAYTNRWLGPFTAPTHLLHPAMWSDEEKVPRTPFVGLRIYEDSWDLEKRRVKDGPITRVRTFEYFSR